jgi:hypothetical protein
MEKIDPVMEQVLKVLEDNGVEAFALSFGTHDGSKFTVCASISGTPRELGLMINGLAEGARNSLGECTHGASGTLH